MYVWAGTLLEQIAHIASAHTQATNGRKGGGRGAKGGGRATLGGDSLDY